MLENYNNIPDKIVQKKSFLILFKIYLYFKNIVNLSFTNTCYQKMFKYSSKLPTSYINKFVIYLQISI